MDLLAELNSLADIAHSSECVEAIGAAVERWQGLFGYGPEEAKEQLLEQRQNLATGLISEDLWRITQAAGKAPGHDRESYTHLIGISQRQSRSGNDRILSSDEEYLFKLGGKITTAAQLQQIACLDTTPVVHTGVSTEEDHTTAQFCIVNSSAREKVVDWSAKQKQPRPDFILVSIAPKAFSNHSMAPMLGKVTTLPQNRMNDSSHPPKPQQDEYPVWYFFYGTLQDPEKLRSIFGGSPDESYALRQAKLSGGKLTEWGNKYKALIDAPATLCESSGEGIVDGKAFLVRTKDHEDALRLYETKAYEVVRCTIVFEDGGDVAGCTFRYRER